MVRMFIEKAHIALPVTAISGCRAWGNLASFLCDRYSLMGEKGDRHDERLYRTARRRHAKE
ncbi:protein of unknown function [Nitrospira japonica]|uniref:Uncharacterized protein n=1 Tax=Nitrospira japonica TaxID=1325564 RepID=A0A1W1I469_9BACT|nr:protein of unknown function [Nitrospira japonica]